MQEAKICVKKKNGPERATFMLSTCTFLKSTKPLVLGQKYFNKIIKLSI
jgi:hypothetical protein